MTQQKYKTDRTMEQNAPIYAVFNKTLTPCNANETDRTIFVTLFGHVPYLKINFADLCHLCTQKGNTSQQNWGGGGGGGIFTAFVFT